MGSLRYHDDIKEKGIHLYAYCRSCRKGFDASPNDYYYDYSYYEDYLCKCPRCSKYTEQYSVYTDFEKKLNKIIDRPLKEQAQTQTTMMLSILEDDD